MLSKENMRVSSTNIPKTNATLEIKHTIDNIANGYDKDTEYLQQYQYLVREYLAKSGSRGVLIFHSPGFGKSITAASITEYIRQHEPTRKIILLLSKSLQDNFRGNIRKYIKATGSDRSGKSGKSEEPDTVLDTKYKFVSLNASNMYTQISSIDKTEAAIEYDKSLGKLDDMFIGTGAFLENSIIIIDEVHNFSVSIKNGSKNATTLYNKIMHTKNIKLVFLTGTPIVNTPFELVPIFNMLRGYIRDGRERGTLFPENEEKFNAFFVDYENNDILNKEVFQNRITGLCSYYGNRYFGDQRITGFPEEKPLKIVPVVMSDFQLVKYQEIRSIEEKEESGRFSKTQRAERFIDKNRSDSKSSYRIRSRQVCNFAIPDYAMEEFRDGNSIRKRANVYKIKQSDLKNLHKYSPKFMEIIHNIKLTPNVLNVVYSEFVETGINLLAMVLKETEGYVYWRDNPANTKPDDIAGNEFDLGDMSESQKKMEKKSVKSVKSYALISGNVPFSERSHIIKVFNSKDNMDGKLISILLISRSGSEGLTLKNVRAIHIMEPFWNYARIEQIIARGSRYLSHKELPEESRDIQPYLYIMEFPSGTNKEDGELTTDRKLLKSAISGKILREKFEITLIESSIDCSFHKKSLSDDIQNTIDCHMCLPNNRPLYNTDINSDILHNNCTPFSLTERYIKAVDIDGKDYYYSDEVGITIYEFDDSIGNYIEMRKDNPMYANITKKILGLPYES